MEGQTQYAEQVVRIQPGTLAVGSRAQGEEVLEDAPVDDHPGDQRHQHEHAGQADDVDPRHAGMQAVVQLEEEVAAQGLGQWLAAGRIEGDVMHLLRSVHFPAQPPVGLALGRPVHPEGVQLVLDVALQPVAHLVGSHAGGGGLVQRRTHPALQLLVETGDGAGENDHVEQPAGQQTAPGMQARHGLTQIHGRTPRSLGRKAARPSASVRPPSHNQARVALRAANT